MRSMLVVACTLVSGPALAADLDCSALKSTRMPFAIEYEVSRIRDGKELSAPTRETLQVYRGAAKTITYHLNAPGRFVRNRLVDPLFPLESAASNGTIVRRWKYSIDTGGGRFARREPLDFTTELFNPDETLFLQATSTIRFAGTAATEVQGCKFEGRSGWYAPTTARPRASRLRTAPNSGNRPNCRRPCSAASSTAGFSSTYVVKGITSQIQRPQ